MDISDASVATVLMAHNCVSTIRDIRCRILALDAPQVPVACISQNRNLLTAGC
ncbi:hypothetical protein H634G_11399 [Metarhizium anisopliae BRIP 53293]|uniref:Uncharacterized protein n=1 Tax=Metarhizium anisopliae BRIP 53293 TaxID=1291518 RepID=A0A0D9NL94_METAN|nr:hypothetical protein H634G_11399 [Metarhizium anisopliae BRIP 53293]